MLSLQNETEELKQLLSCPCSSPDWDKASSALLLLFLLAWTTDCMYFYYAFQRIGSPAHPPGSDKILGLARALSVRSHVDLCSPKAFTFAHECKTPWTTLPGAWSTTQKVHVQPSLEAPYHSPLGLTVSACMFLGTMHSAMEQPCLFSGALHKGFFFIGRIPNSSLKFTL